MSFEAIARVVESSETTGVTRMVVFLIASHESEDRGAFPAVHTLAREANCGERTVQDAIGRAKALGELEVKYRAGPHGVNIYRTLCGLRGIAPLPDADTPESAGVRDLRGADVRRESAPELKELGLGVVVVPTDLDSNLDLKAASAADTNPNQPTHDQLDLARKLGEEWGQDLTPAAIVKLNKAHGRRHVEDALRSLRGFPPEEAVRKLYAYVAQIAEDNAAVAS